jgi:hypothetical protein
MNPFRKLGVYSVLALLFVAYSRIFDFAFARLHIPAICSLLVIASCILCGAFVTAFTSRIGLMLLGFTLCMFADVPFSVWKGGSFALVTETWPKSLMVFIGVAGLVATLRQCKQVMLTLALGTGALAWFSVMLGGASHGRLVLSEGTKFANPNDLAQALLIGLPFWFLLARNPNRTPFRRIIPVAFIALMMGVLAKTGSRGAFITAIALMLVVFWHATPAGKLGLVVASFVVLGLGVFFLPRTLVNRYLTMTAQEEPETIDAVDLGADDSVRFSAVESSANRMAMLKESIRLTLAHPLVGVGPGMFAVAVADAAKERGKHVMFLETHNSYTQVSSECGLPAVIFYVGTLLTCLFRITYIFRQFRGRTDPRHAEIAAMAFALRASLFAYAVTAVFSSVAYQAMFPSLAGLSVAFIASVRGDLEQLKTAPAAALAQRPAHPVRRPAPWQARPAVRAGIRPQAS